MLHGSYMTGTPLALLFFLKSSLYTFQQFANPPTYFGRKSRLADLECWDSFCTEATNPSILLCSKYGNFQQLLSRDHKAFCVCQKAFPSLLSRYREIKYSLQVCMAFYPIFKIMSLYFFMPSLVQQRLWQHHTMVTKNACENWCCKELISTFRERYGRILNFKWDCKKDQAKMQDSRPILL